MTVVIHTTSYKPLKVGNPTIPIVHKPKIDKISACVPIIDLEEQQAVRQVLIACIKSPEDGFLELKGAGGYKLQVKMHLPDALGGWGSEFVLIQADPFSPKTAFIRMEWNPYKAGPKGMEYLKAMLTSMLPEGYGQVIKNGKVSRLDIALDLPGTHLDDLLIKANQMRTAMHRAGTDGRLETVYLGRPTSNQVVAYDKNKELSKSGKGGVGDMTRIEFRLKPQMPMIKLPSIKNPLRRLIIHDLSCWTSGLPPTFALFRDACRIRGMKAALQMAGPHAPLITKALKPTVQSWWQPDVLWSAWGEVLEASELLTAE